MRTLTFAITVVAALALGGCGSSDPQPDAATPAPSATVGPATPAPSSSVASKPATPKAATDAQVQSTVDNARDYAVALEQVFFGQGYPRDLAGAVTVAKKLTNLSLASGNTFGTYVYDESDQEFKLCVQNTSGAYSTYDTRPMTTIETGKSGGCR